MNYTQDVKETLGKLYALRAGLSAIALENDKKNALIDKKDRETKKHLDAISKAKSEKNQAESSYKEVCSTITSKERTKKYATKFWWAATVTLLTLGVIYGTLWVCNIKSIWAEWVSLFGILGSIAMISLTWYTWKDYREGRREGADLEPLRRKKSGLQTQIAKTTKTIEDNDAIVKNAENKCLQECQLPYKRAVEINQALLKAYSDLISPTDWAELDMVIYAYETGRASTMSKALEFADGERRMNTITKHIEAAANSIRNTIEDGFKGLAINMVKCFQVISGQIEANARATGAQIAALANKIDYANALQAKRNVASQQLYAENKVFLSQARAYMDNATVKARMGY